MSRYIILSKEDIELILERGCSSESKVYIINHTRIFSRYERYAFNLDHIFGYSPSVRANGDRALVKR